MAFTQPELDSIANGALDFYLRRQPYLQSVEDKPTLAKFDAKAKTFPGGKGNISLPIKGDYATTVTGYTHDDTVSYVNPAHLKRAEYPWREHHAGITVTHTELKIDGLSVVDSAFGRNTSSHSDRDMTVLVNLLEDKLEDLSEGSARGLSNLMINDGTADTKALAGLKSLVTATPATGTTGGLSRVDNAWWRNRYKVIKPYGATGQTRSITEEITAEIRQLRRFGGRPDFIIAGSDFLDGILREVYEKGMFTQSGWTSSGSTDIGMADVAYKGLKFVYEPELDNQSMADECFILDCRRIYLYKMEGEWGKRHAPARPAEKYVLYKSVTWTGQLVCDQLNAQGRYKYDPATT